MSAKREVTVEEAINEVLNELREMFPHLVSEISFRTAEMVSITVWERDVIPRSRVRRLGPTIEEAMAQLRQFQQVESS